MRRTHDPIPNPRAATPKPVNRTWKQRRYWTEVRHNLLFAAVVLAATATLAILWSAGQGSTGATPAPHVGNALHLR